MKNILLCSPTYILRKECSENLFAVLSKLSEIGFDGVEFVGFFGRSAGDVRDKMKDLNIVPLSNHVGYAEISSDIKSVIDFHTKVGCRYIVVGGIPQNGFPGGSDFTDTKKQLIEIGRACKENGISLLYHNHAQEIRQKVDGKCVLEVLLDEIPEEYLALEPDLGWIAIGGGDPAYFLKKYLSRCPVIHLKDFYTNDASKTIGAGLTDRVRGLVDDWQIEFRPIGYGMANIPSYIDLVFACNPECIVMDHDLAFRRSSFDDLQLSLSYFRNLVRIHRAE